MKKRLRSIFWVESVLASVSAFLAILTFVWPDWIEGVSGFDPDQHNGSVEWGVVIALVMATVIFAALARREWYRAPQGSI